MKTIAALALVFALATAHPVSQSLTEAVNSAKTTWTAMSPEENPFSYMTEEEIRSLMGTKLVDTPEIRPRLSDAAIKAAPKSYNFLEEADCTHAIRDQASCGSCWAFGAAEAMTDRLCLVSKGEIDIELSTEDMVECDKLNFGCNGGMMFTAWRYLEKTGIVSEECYKYHSGDGHTETCHDACDADSKDTWQKHKCEAGSVVHPKTTADIKAEISANGPMELAFTVYEDFMAYRTGVYQHVTGKQLGGHAVEVIGYGEEDGVEYWLCANSWNTSWGENGYFKIAIGDSGSNDQIYACTPEH
jgi:cathepsin B